MVKTNRLKKLQLVKQGDGSTTESDTPSLPGRVTHDERGNAIWDWDISTNVLNRKSVDELLTTLDTPGGLSLDSDSDSKGVWSGDPYNRGR